MSDIREGTFIRYVAEAGEGIVRAGTVVECKDRVHFFVQRTNSILECNRCHDGLIGTYDEDDEKYVNEEVERYQILDFYNATDDDGTRSLLRTALCTKTYRWVARRIKTVKFRNDDPEGEYYAFTTRENILGSRVFPDTAHGKPVYLASWSRAVIDNVHMELLQHPDYAVARVPEEGDYVVGVVRKNKQGAYYSQWAVCDVSLINFLRGLRYGFSDGVRAFLSRVEIGEDGRYGDEQVLDSADIYKAMAVMCFYEEYARISPEWVLPTLYADLCEPCFMQSIGASETAPHVCKQCLDYYYCRDSDDEEQQIGKVEQEQEQKNADGDNQEKEYGNCAQNDGVPVAPNTNDDEQQDGVDAQTQEEHAHDAQYARKALVFETYWPIAIRWWV